MKVFLFLDLLLLKQFQKFSVWFQKLTGITCFQLAKFFGKIAFIGITLDYISGFFIGKAQFLLVFDSAFWLYCIWAFWRFLLLCEALDAKYANGFRFGNDLIMHPRFMMNRTILLFLVIVYTGLFLLLAFGSESEYVWWILPFFVSVVTTWFCACFVVCTPLPPNQSKVKTWLKKAKEKVQETFLPTPEPCPVTSLISEIKTMRGDEL